MKTLVGDSKRYLDVDLSTRSCSVFGPMEADLRYYIGGKGLGVKMYYDRLKGRLGDIDPLGADNILIFLAGPFLATGAPCSARFAAVTKSPLTGIMASSSCGGPFGMALRTAGWDGLLVRGASSSPLVLRIDEDGVSFEDGTAIWGLGTEAAKARLVDNPRQGELLIGPAGENLVRYANIRSGNRYLGRAGLGAVMGAKKLKAVIANGGAFRVESADPAAFGKASARMRKHVLRNGFSRSYRAYGTNYNVRPGMKAGFLPVMNFRDRTDPRFESLSGEAMAARYDTRHSTCSPCTVLCGHKGSYPDGKTRHIPEYETTGSWGGNIGNWDPDLIGSWNELMNDLGMDTISAGVTFSWAMEAAEKGIRKSELAFGRTDNIATLIEDTALRRGEGADLAEGSRRLSDKYGGKDFAIQVKGLELASYDPRAGWGQGLNYAVANRGGCHLNAYPIGLEALYGFLDPYSIRGKADWVAFMEDLFDAFNATQTCLFTVFGTLLETLVPKLSPKPVLKFAMTWFPDIAQLLLNWSSVSDQVAAITGRKVSQRDYLLAGRRCHVLERYMNTRMGVSRMNDDLPARFLSEAETKHPKRSVVDLEPMLGEYYRKKGYDANGIPTAATLAKLGIDTE
ncbi:MAG TPA: aldehyde ferredoxin oxidoreductase family protein [Rectinemataceae bacterium]|nr:aldehyde ferredoxin oxidoreductase family protein [Rectinemataceae bacterium]